MGYRNDDGCGLILFLLPFYLIGWGIEIAIKLAGTFFLAVLAITWVILGFPFFYLMEFFGGDATEGWGYGNFLGKMLEELWEAKIIMPK